MTDIYKQQIIWFQNTVSKEKYILGLVGYYNSFPVVLYFGKISPWMLVTRNCRWAGTAEEGKSEVIFVRRCKSLFCFKLVRSKTTWQQMSVSEAKHFRTEISLCLSLCIHIINNKQTYLVILRNVFTYSELLIYLGES